MGHEQRCQEARWRFAGSESGSQLFTDPLTHPFIYISRVGARCGKFSYPEGWAHEKGEVGRELTFQPFIHPSTHPSIHPFTIDPSIIYPSTHLSSVDTWVVSIFYLLWIVPPWTCASKPLFPASNSWRQILKVELLTHLEIPSFPFWGTTRLTSTAAAPFCILTSHWWEHNSFTSFQCLLFSSLLLSSCEVVPHWGFDWRFPDDAPCIFLCARWPSARALWGSVYSKPLPIFEIRLLVFLRLSL